MARVLVVAKYYPPFRGGIEQNTQQVAEALAVRHHVTVLAYNHEPGEHRETRNGVEVIRRALLGVLGSQPIGRRFLSGLRLSDFDIIHFHAPNPVASVLLLARLLPMRRRPALVITHHMDIFGRRGLRDAAIVAYKALIRRSQAVIVTSRKNVAVSRDLPAVANYVAVPLGIDPAAYGLDHAGLERAAAWRQTLAGDAPLVGFVGRHARYKGLDTLVRAIARLDGVHAVLAGDGPYRPAAESLAAKLGVSDRVHFIGLVDEATKVALLSSIDVFAFPSTEITEAFGVSQLEAMACGTPVVAANLPTGVTDVAIDEETALLVPPGDDDALARQIGRLLADPALAARLRDAARQHILRTMTSERVTEQTCRVIEKAGTTAGSLASDGDVDDLRAIAFNGRGNSAEIA